LKVIDDNSIDSSDKGSFSVHSISSLLKGDTGSYMRQKEIPDINPLMDRSSHSFKDSLNSSVNYAPAYRPPILRKPRHEVKSREES
jgi:hypothetical protein